MATRKKTIETNRNNVVASVASPRQKLIVEITGLEKVTDLDVQGDDKDMARERRETTGRISSRKNIVGSCVNSTGVTAKSMANGTAKLPNEVQSDAFPMDSIRLENLPVISYSMSDNDLRDELKLRDPYVCTVDKNKGWLLDKLKSGTICILKAREILGDDVIDQLPKVSDSMSVDDLRREFLFRHPSKKQITRGKWKDWYLYQLGEGSICVAPVEKPLIRAQKSAPGSPQSSIANTVSTIPTLFSTSTQDSALTGESQLSSIEVRDLNLGNRSAAFSSGKDSVSNEEVPRQSESVIVSLMASKKKYYEASKAAKKRRESWSGPSAAATEELDPPKEEKRSVSRRNMSSKQKYFEASKIAKRSESSQRDTNLLSKFGANVCASDREASKGEETNASYGFQKIVTEKEPSNFTSKMSQINANPNYSDSLLMHVMSKRVTVGTCIEKYEGNSNENKDESKQGGPIFDNAAPVPGSSAKGSTKWMNNLKQARKGSQRRNLG